MTCAEPRGAEHTGHQYTHGITGEVTYCCPAHQDGYAWLDDARAQLARLREALEMYLEADGHTMSCVWDIDGPCLPRCAATRAALGTKGAGDE